MQLQGLFPHNSCCVTVTDPHVAGEDVCFSALYSNFESLLWFPQRTYRAWEIMWVHVVDIRDPSTVTENLSQNCALLVEKTAMSEGEKSVKWKRESVLKFLGYFSLFCHFVINVYWNLYKIQSKNDNPICPGVFMSSLAQWNSHLYWNALVPLKEN